MTKEQILSKFKDSIPAWKSKSARSRYPALVSRFITFTGVKAAYTKQDAIYFLNHLMSEGCKPSYMRWAAFVLITFYKCMGYPRPFEARELPPVPREHEMVKPTLPPDKVKQLISAVKERGSSRMKAYLAVSTTYGLRATELAALSSPADFNGGFITVKTAKGGVLGKHPIPAEIAPYVLKYKFKPCQPQVMVKLFNDIQELAGQKHQPHEGFHSIRRGLVKGLSDNKVEPRYVNFFLRWSTRSMGMLATYSAPGPEEYAPAHEQIFARHPYLSEWKEVNSDKRATSNHKRKERA